MAKKITIHVQQVIDDEVTIDSVKTYQSVKEFEDARQEAINNWEDMQGGSGEVECYGEVCGLGLCLELTVPDSYDREKWECIGYEDLDDSKVTSLKEKLTDIKNQFESARSSHKKIPYAECGKNFRDWISTMDDAELGKMCDNFMG